MKSKPILWPRILCEPGDDITPCPVRVVAAMTVIVYHCGIIYIVGVEHAHVVFDMLSEYIKDMMILAGVLGPAIGVKSYLRGDAPPPGDSK